MSAAVMNKNLCIHSWPGSYYLHSEKRWVYGKLSLTPGQLTFTSDKEGLTLTSFKLSAITSIKKEASSFIFSSLTVLVNGNEKHWFSSLQPNRTVVFNVIEHFWQAQLLSSEGVEVESSPDCTSKGKQLIHLASSSHQRLEDTAKVLHHQGEQFDRIMKGLDKIESDMDVANRLLTELESPPWWPFSSRHRKAQQETKSRQELPRSASKAFGKEGLILKVPVLYSQGQDPNLKQGTLAVLCSGLEICDSNDQLVHKFRREEVDDVKVQSPYEMVVRQRFIGKPDISFTLQSAKMTDVVSIVEIQYSKKVQFRDDLLGLFRPEDSPVSENLSMGDSIWNAATGFLDRVMHPISASGGQMSQQVSEQTVSEAEAQELRQILRKLKTIALDTEAELERQDEVLDVISSSTDQATSRINMSHRRMRKLL
ncbi:synaptosomal-associated protein 47 [Stegostoma tigrinum]|uniref:synaptosomal-associated protein 47 n=1 Tax=Stegostoma tigrinum TaxID=3053191 RepID=UPI00202B56EE|nr:synaptosomal-associated protein 47 [Stegostoma tigrinum]XP_048385667.1 synaptosomal-associated protein 47 [Stegostoma tigrinum]XP_048385668.1 synaptosomal-associated protein 47 [Stegostoma tigrinum]XP_059502148.1 synaptosomal-associated protein 47 [Stegostoma tigrinum]